MGRIDSDNAGEKFKTIIDTATCMLMNGEDLFVNKNDFTPPKINARESHNFTQDGILVGQQVDLHWLSKRGFNIGVVFFGAGREITISESFSLDTKTFIAQFDLFEIYSILFSSHNTSENNIIKILSEKNNFSSWLFWPQYPSAFIYQQQPDSYMQDLTSTYEQWFQRSEPCWDFKGQQREYDTDVVRATYKGCNRTKKTDESIYRFSVSYHSKSESYHLVSFDNKWFLLDYIYDAVPVTNSMYHKIIEACIAKMPRR